MLGSQFILPHPGKPEKEVLCTLLKRCLHFCSHLWKSIITGKKIISDSFRTPPSACFQMTDFVRSVICSGGGVRIFIVTNNQEDKREICYIKLFGIEHLLLIRSASNWDITDVMHFQF